MYAVIKTGGKQYRVQEGDELRVELIKGAEAGGEVSFDEVLMVSGDEIKVGQPLIDGASVKAKVIRNARARKVIVYKWRRRGGSRKKRGHRQSFTQIKITQISA